MSQVTVTTANQAMTVVSSRVVTITVTLVPSAVNLPASGQHDVHTTADVASFGQYEVVLYIFSFDTYMVLRKNGTRLVSCEPGKYLNLLDHQVHSFSVCSK